MTLDTPPPPAPPPARVRSAIQYNRLHTPDI